MDYIVHGVTKSQIRLINFYFHFLSNHFQFIFVCGVRKCSNFILLHVAVYAPTTTYWRDYSFSIACLFLLCPQVPKFIYGIPILCHWSMSQYYIVLITIVCSVIWSLVGWFLQLCFSFSRLILLFGVFYVSIQIEKSFVLVRWRMSLVI